MFYRPTIHWKTVTSSLYLICQLQNCFTCTWTNSTLRRLFCQQLSLHLLSVTFETRDPRCLTSRQLCTFDTTGAAIFSILLCIVAKLSRKKITPVNRLLDFLIQFL